MTPTGPLISVSTASSTGEGAITPGSVVSGPETPQQTAGVTTVFYMPMPPPATHGSLIFEGPNVSEFLEWYEDLCTDYQVFDEDKLARLP